jgi:hypothetical protein
MLLIAQKIDQIFNNSVKKKNNISDGSGVINYLIASHRRTHFSPYLHAASKSGTFIKTTRGEQRRAFLRPTP